MARALLPKLGHHSPRATCVSLESVQRRVIRYLREITRGEGSEEMELFSLKRRKMGRDVVVLRVLRFRERVLCVLSQWVVQEVRGFLE